MSKEITLIAIRANGAWNKKIFQPNWLMKYLPKIEKPGDIKVLINFEDVNLGYEIKKFKILPTDNTLEINTNTDLENPNQHIFMTELFFTILKTLPHTPITAVGFNIHYRFSQDDDNILANFLKTCKQQKIVDLEPSEFHHSYKKDDYIINIITTLKEKNQFETVFNFHYNKKPPFNEKILSEHIVETKEILKWK